MTITLYRQISETNKLEKTLTDPFTIEGNFRGPANVLEPVLSVSSLQNLSNYNYMYIPDFGRYYFITGNEVTRQGIWEIRGSVDVLMTYADEIKKLTATVRRNASNVNEELKDPKMVMLNRTTIQGKKLVGNFDREHVYPYVLVVAGKSDITTPAANNEEVAV